MNRTANLFTTVTLEWQDERGRYHDAEVEVDYTYDGEDLNIVKTRPIGDTDSLDDDWYDEQVWESVSEYADEAYAEWQADYGDWLYEQAKDRRDAA